MPNAKAKTKGAVTPPAKRRRTDTVSRPAERPSYLAAYFDDVVSPASSVPCSDVVEGSMGGHGMEDPQPGTSTDPNLTVAGKLVKTAEAIILSETDVINVCGKNIEENIAWLKMATDDQNKLLRDYLLNLDASNRIDFKSPRSKAICGGVDEIMKKICTKMGERDPRFTCNLVPMGSANNQTKIDDLNEFDYVCELIIPNLLQGKGTVTYRVSDIDKINVHFGNLADYDLCKPLVELLTDYSSDSSENTNPQNIEFPINSRLDSWEIHIRFCDILESVLQELELPPGWCHGGYNRPTCSGWRRNGVAHLLQFDYLGTCENAPLRLSVDFVPMVRYLLSEDPPEINFHNLKGLCSFCIHKTGVKHGWLSLRYGQFCDSKAEELLFTKYSSDSMPKTVMRVGKVLGRLIKMKCKQFVRKIYSTFELLDNESTIWQRMEPLEKFLDAPEINEYLTCSDVGEIRGDVCLLTSYSIKRTVMSMIRASETHGHNWTEDDLPDLVICLYMWIFDQTENCNLSSRNKDFYHVYCDRFPVSLGDNSDKNKDLNSSIKVETVKHSADFKLDETITYLQTHKMYVDLESRIDPRRPPLLLSRLSAIFQLLRSVCEGLNTAEIVMHHRVICRYFKDILVTKEEYKGKAMVVDNELLLAIKIKEIKNVLNGKVMRVNVNLHKEWKYCTSRHNGLHTEYFIERCKDHKKSY